jgi:hypothetical protein
MLPKGLIGSSRLCGAQSTNRLNDEILVGGPRSSQRNCRGVFVDGTFNEIFYYKYAI